MKCTTLQYKQHFNNFSERLFLLHPESQINSLNKDEHFLLKNYGLPDYGLPFFVFDLSLQYLRELDSPDILFILGNPINSLSDEYIYIAQDHSIKIRDDQNNIYFLNSSLRHLINCIYTYSVWLEQIEKLSLITGKSTVDNKDIFDIYYQLRNIDKSAFKSEYIWEEIVNTKIKLPSNLPEFA